MHECGECGAVCDCDGEDTWLDQPDDCAHVCEMDNEDGLAGDCRCGAWQWSQEYGCFVQVADCIC